MQVLKKISVFLLKHDPGNDQNVPAVLKLNHNTVAGGFCPRGAFVQGAFVLFPYDRPV
jgi:hypothetical protein